MNKKSIIYLVFLCLLIISAGCSKKTEATLPAQSWITEDIRPTKTPAQQTNTPTVTITPTPTHVPENTATPTLPATQTPQEPGITQACIPILATPPDDFQSSDRLLLRDKRLFLLDVRTGQKTILPILDPKVIISPANTQYAAQTANQIRVFSSMGKMLKDFTIPDHWILDRWLDEMHLIFILVEYRNPWLVKIPPIQIVMDLSTMSTVELRSELPYIYSGEPVFWSKWSYSGIAVYDSSLTRVIYKGSEVYWDRVILWDLEKNREIAKLESYSITNPLIWSQDGSKILINTKNGEFYSISRDGIITQLSHFISTVYETSGSYSWSPDGQTIAFWWIMEDGFQTFSLLDTQTGKAEDYCISWGGESLLNQPFYPGLPIWSSDGEQLVISANMSEDRRNWDVIVVDINRKMAIKVAENQDPVGWLALDKKNQQGTSKQ